MPIIRSKPGECPRRETGKLQNAVRHEVERLLFDVIELSIINDCPYATFLENGTGIMSPRPFMAREFERLTDKLADDLNDAVAGRL